MKRLTAISTAACGITSSFFLLQSATAAPLLPDPVSYEYIGISFAEYELTSNSVGTLDYSGQPGCGGVCTATTQLGASPSVSITTNEVVYDNSSGGRVEASLGYYVEYLNTPGTYTVDLHSTASISIPDGTSAGSAALTFGPAGTSTTSFNNFASVTLQEANCVNGCPSPGFVPSTGPFVADQPVQMLANTPYFVQLDLMLAPQPTGVQLNELVDPTFSASSGGQFIFSPGVLSPVPEPATWASMLAGLAAIGLYLRRRTPDPAMG